MKKVLSTDEQIEKLEQATRLAIDATMSNDIGRRLGAFLLYSGMVDFLVIQAARLMEQILLKGQLAEGKKPMFMPHDDAYFYDKKISTRFILKGIRKLLPFQSAGNPSDKETLRLNELANKMIEAGFDFLNYRNPIVHHIGNPTETFNNLISLCDQAISKYKRFREAHKIFMVVAGPYRFGPKELEYFYGRSLKQQ
jgi:hypothetical protein